MRFFKCIVEYDGTDFCGWQRQPRLRTVQGEFEKALRTMTRSKINVVAAGRTDSGVHAVGQVVSFGIDRDWDRGVILRGMNANLPDDVVIHKCTRVSDRFNARYDAVSREYRYRVCAGRSALLRRDHLCRYDEFSFETLQRLATLLEGEHDFASFCVKKSRKESNLCTVMKSNWTKNRGVYTFRIVANRFLHGMVRSLVGTMFRVCDGNIDERRFAGLLSRPKRSATILTAPAQGLTLIKVNYR